MTDWLEDILEYTKDAKAITWDTCHKIYILMDSDQVELMQEYGYDPIITAEMMTPEVMASTVMDWYDQSCGLRFVNAVETTPNPNDGFTTIISQFADEDEYEEDDDDWNTPPDEGDFNSDADELADEIITIPEDSFINDEQEML